MSKCKLTACTCGRLFDENGFHAEASREDGMCKSCMSKVDREHKKGKPRTSKRSDKDSMEYLVELVE